MTQIYDVIITIYHLKSQINDVAKKATSMKWRLDIIIAVHSITIYIWICVDYFTFFIA